jgi:hypothetical protein
LSQTIEIRHDDDFSYLRITPNVDALLRGLRAFNKPRYLWIDAICLNQDDETEKAQQIPKMRLIFGEAKEVYIWLGLEDHMTAKLFKFFRTTHQLREASQQAMAARIAFLMRKVLNDNYDGIGLTALLKFFDRPWFSRRWVIQEACQVNRATIYCGKYSIPLVVITSAARRFQSLDMPSYPIKMAANLGRSTLNLSLLDLLWTFHEAECVENKDRIASLLGLMPLDEPFHLDYAIHWTELYKKVASSILEFGDNNTRLQIMLHLIEFGPVSQPENSSYPSWVPNWSKTRRRKLPFNSHIRNTDTFEPCPVSPGHADRATISFYRGILQVHWHALMAGPRGRQVTYTKNFDSRLHTEDGRTERVISVLQELFPSTSDSIPHIIALSSLLNVIAQFRWSTLGSGLSSASFDAYIRNISQELSISSDREVLSCLTKLDPLLQEFSLFELEPCGLGLETSRCFGFGSKKTQVGDVMIPLWRLKWKPGKYGLCLGGDGPAIHMITMLTVRCIEEQHPRNQMSMSIEGRMVGTIIGAAVSITTGSVIAYKPDQSIDMERDTYLGTERQCSMHLV